MNILHIGGIRNLQQSGVCVVVPQHLESQLNFANVALFNLNDYDPRKANMNYPLYLSSEYNTKIDNLPSPFNNPDLVVFHEVYRPSFARLSMELNKRKIPYIIVPHSSLTDISQSTKKNKKQLGNFFMFNRFIKNAAAIHYLSDFEMKSSSKWKTKSFISSNGMVLPKVKKDSFSKQGLKLIYVGRLDIWQKGLDILLHSASLIKNQMIKNKIEITIAGTDHENNKLELKNLIKKYNLEKVVHLKNAVFGDQKINLLLKQDCFIQLSRSEGQPMGMLEAMGLGLPPIGTEGTSLKEIISKHDLGFVVEADPKIIAETILSIFNNKKLLPRYSRNSRKYISEHHNWDYIGRTTVEYYSKYARKTY